MVDNMQDFNYNELKQRGTTDFPIDYHYIEESHPQYEMPFHWHMDYEFLQILEGNFHLFLDGVEYSLAKGDVCFIPAGVLHGGIPNKCIYECVVFDIELLRSRGFLHDTFLRQVAHQELTYHMVYKNQDIITSPGIIHSIQTLIHALKQQEVGYELITISSLLSFFGWIKHDHYYELEPQVNKKLHKRTDQLKTVLEYIEKAYASPITLEDLAACAKMSEKYFCRVFKDMTHKTVMDYLNHYRIERACHQLNQTNFSLLEICYNCGFNDLSYFIKTFKKYKGITPKKYASIDF
jgi:AraC-like DNA-binding protein